MCMEPRDQQNRALWNKPFNVAYNNVFRNIFVLDRRCSVSSEMVNRRINTCETTIRIYVNSSLKRIMSSTTEILQQFCESDIIISSALFKEWNNKLYVMT